MYLSTDYLLIFLLLCYFMNSWPNIYITGVHNINGCKGPYIMIIIFRFHLIICGFLVIALSLGGCSSSNVTDETSEEPTESALNEDDDEYGETEDDELEFGEDDDAGDERFEDDEFAEDLPEEAPLDLEDDSEPLLSDSEEAPELPELPVAGGGSELPEPSIGDGFEESSSLPALPVEGDQDQSQFTSDSYSPPPSPSFDDDNSVAQAPRRISVKKIKSYPYNRAGMLVNAVYIARSGDDLYSISQKIYGADRVADLLAINPNLQRGVDVGDKIYYNSPNRPTDSGTLLFYYEDIGVGPQQYTVGRGENIRNIAQQFFGERESWKELWATNFEVESKWGLNEGTVLRYWDGSVSAPPPPPVVSNEVVEEQHPVQEVVQENNFDPPPPQEEIVPDIAGATGNEFLPGPEAVPLPPDSGGGFANNDEFQQSPPPPSLEQPPPPPPLAMADQGQDGGAGGLLEDEDSLLFLIAGIVVIMFMLMIVVRRKAKRRKMRMNIGDTQI